MPPRVPPPPPQLQRQHKIPNSFRVVVARAFEKQGVVELAVTISTRNHIPPRWDVTQADPDDEREGTPISNVEWTDDPQEAWGSFNFAIEGDYEVLI